MVAAAWVISQVPSTFSRMTVRKPLALMSSAGVRYCPPALFTSRSMRPWRSSTPSISAPTWSSSRMSQLRASIPSARAAVSASGSSRRPQTTTRAPSAASSSALARPSPLPPPLTMATWPSSRPGWKSFDGIAAAA